ncbi:MAG TPA: class I adenylate-forming enzyme family protein [Bryobacteraceae bacterium]|nr:class I adenylate-forming enzyme family protein [Bryobacteraceae bacterium]
MIFEQFTQTAEQYRNELAIVEGDERITYGQLLDRIASTRGWLRRTLNPEPGSVIAASLSNTRQFVAAFFAVSELGAVFTPCNPQWRAAELRWLVRRLGISGAIAEQQFRPAWDRLGDVVPPQAVLTAPIAASAGEPAAALRLRAGSADAPTLYLTTSGSTGVPRLVPRSHRNLAAGAKNLARSLGIGPGDCVLGAAPFYHSNGFHNCMLMPLLCGATVVLMPRFTPTACAELLRHENVNLLIGSPAIYRFLAEGSAHLTLPSSMRCFSAGARMPEALSKRWKDRFGIRVRQWYGMAEANTLSIDRAPDEQASGAGAYVGSPIEGVDVRVLDADGNALDPGAVGEIAVRSDAVMSGYYGEPELNRRKFRGGFFRTGDSGYFDTAGKLYLTGRIGRVINIGGVKVDPVEVEQAIEGLAGVSACHVDAVTSESTSEVIRARVAVRSGMQLARTEVIEQCRARLAEYKLPRIVEFVDSLPMTLAGKTPAAWTTDEPAR